MVETINLSEIDQSKTQLKTFLNCENCPTDRIYLTCVLSLCIVLVCACACVCVCVCGVRVFRAIGWFS